jgi:hypothetical protein
MLVPGGLAIFIEPDLIPIIDGTAVPDSTIAAGHGASGWVTLWETFRGSLGQQGIDISIPGRITDILAETGVFENITTRDANIPIGEWTY